MRHSARLFWPLAITLVLIDCTTKRVVEGAVPVAGIPHSVVRDVLRVTLEYNRGGAMSTHLGIHEHRLASARGVTDFIDVGVGAHRFYVFNVADIGVSVGALLLAYALSRATRLATDGDRAPYEKVRL